MAAILGGTEVGAATYIVTIEGMEFRPSTLVLHRGDRVVWVNQDLVPHTATASDGKGFDSGHIAPGASWEHVVQGQGSLPYVCTLHPTMQAVLEVRKR
ncbi:cupredoxin family copper-binding protein [Cupriavidus gilardii]|uniref:Cupredoxin family copper-binding protein n=2 Tax=Cupriavidus gilardii TaxID=82541 RepID=A0A849BDZ1_9BURK|nr:cupredoxin family copper-binding protein [Cupriavidus gilardii]ALD93035.1 Plastocyanin [Cupriavidus gilardii CR3]QQE08491.1 cupredoxin family copper-binding protein [Cupriavidus sp. ISTL7]KAB0599682.1 copper-binding protein [Cupriavidus gilardii]MCT9012937.1 cupredoxin family copper-binding protein [Cupriavidus gilardii]MCT9052491.1 cupredoxin family copper-binding protein [Cupriavidus gilardii]